MERFVRICNKLETSPNDPFLMQFGKDGQCDSARLPEVVDFVQVR
jgi:hypothetical protein